MPFRKEVTRENIRRESRREDTASGAADDGGASQEQIGRNFICFRLSREIGMAARVLRAPSPPFGCSRPPSSMDMIPSF